MQKRRILFVYLVLGAALAGVSSAQMSLKSASTRRLAAVTPGATIAPAGGPSDESNCTYFTSHNFPKTKPADFETVALASLKGCVNALDDNIPSSSDISAGIDKAIVQLKDTYKLSTPDQVNEELIKTHYLSRLLRRWANLQKTCPDPNKCAAAAITMLDSIDDRLHSLMEYVGLLEPFAGSLVAGPAFGQTGKVSPGGSAGSSGTAATSAGSKTNALAHVEWGSKHFGDESWSPVDVSFGGSFGLQPALSLLTTPPSTTAPPPPTSQYQSAFVWTLNEHTNLHTGPNAETSAFFEAGQLRLLSGNGATVIDQGANSTLLIPLNNNADKMSWFYGAGAEFKYYNKALEIVHAEKGQIDPAFSIGLWYKIDTRFKQSAGVVGFDSPDRRLVFRFMINGLKIFDRRPGATVSKPYAVSFGVEHERGFGTNPVPNGTQIIIRGDIDLLKLINPGSGS